MTGVPQAIASIITSPNGSGQSIGTSSAIAPLRNADLSLSPISPMYSTYGEVNSRMDLFLVVVAIRPVDLCGNFEWNAAMLGNADRAIDALLGRDASEESEVMGLYRHRDDQILR